ncbi:MAG: DNA-processing protein DprA, partial [Anaerolineae bacterium]
STDRRGLRGETAMGGLQYWVGFNIVPGIGPMRFKALLDYFGDVETAWHADARELKEAGLDRRSIDNLQKMRKKLSLDDEMEKLERAGAYAITWEDDAYPPLLRHIQSPPPLLYIKGRIRPEDEWAVAVVGTRRATVYGKEVTRQLVGGLARNKITVVSGLARGIDGQAHRGALEARGRTIAVLGHGIDIVYPAAHRELAAAIVENGALITDYPLGTQPEGRNFPPRNRIISGISLGVLVVECGERSGALITADYAAEQGRDVFAVPGNIFNRGSKGVNRLIQEGAKPVLCIEDILEELNLTMVSQQAEVRAIVPENETESTLLQYISTEPIHLDEVVRTSGLPTALVSSTLAMMELKGMVRRMEGMNYVLIREGKAEYVIE